VGEGLGVRAENALSPHWTSTDTPVNPYMWAIYPQIAPILGASGAKTLDKPYQMRYNISQWRLSGS
jgi:hypothetical protein